MIQHTEHWEYRLENFLGTNFLGNFLALELAVLWREMSLKDLQFKLCLVFDIWKAYRPKWLFRLYRLYHASVKLKFKSFLISPLFCETLKNPKKNLVGIFSPFNKKIIFFIKYSTGAYTFEYTSHTVFFFTVWKKVIYKKSPGSFNLWSIFREIKGWLFCKFTFNKNFVKYSIADKILDLRGISWIQQNVSNLLRNFL